MTTRSDRMMAVAPDYYAYSDAFAQIQNAIAADMDTVSTNEDDLRLQLRINTATWGLKYWEEALGIVTITSDSYDIRRSRVLSKWRGVGNFSAQLIRSMAEAYSNGDVSVTVDIPNFVVTVTFTGSKGIPSNIDDLKAQIDNVAHAHLETKYVYTYLTWNELDTANHTWDYQDAQALTWNQYEVWGT